MKPFFILFIALAFCLPTSAQVKTVLAGTIDSVYDGYIHGYLSGALTDDTFEFSIPIKQGRFRKSVTLPHYGCYNFSLDANYKRSFGIPIDSSIVTMTVDHNSYGNNTYHGSAVLNAYGMITGLQIEERAAINKLMTLKIKGNADAAEIEAAEKALANSINPIKAKARSIIYTYPNSHISAQLINDKFSPAWPDDSMEALYLRLGGSARSSIYGLHIKMLMERTAKLAIGKPAPDVAAKDMNGLMRRLSDMRGKYVLLDFWASWCYPCRMQTPVLKKTYEEFKSKGLEIISISLDTDPKRWREALRTDQMNWIQLNEPEGWEGYSAKSYLVESVPTIYLISPTGTMLSGDLYEQSIYKTVKKELGNK